MLLLVICLLLYSENLKLAAELKKYKKASKSYKNISIKYVLIIKKYVHVINTRIYKNKKLTEMSDNYYDMIINYISTEMNDHFQLKKILILNKKIDKITKSL